MSWAGACGCGPRRKAGGGQPPTLAPEVPVDHGIQVTAGQCESTADPPRALGSSAGFWGSLARLWGSSSGFWIPQLGFGDPQLGFGVLCWALGVLSLVLVPSAGLWGSSAGLWGPQLGFGLKSVVTVGREKGEGGGASPSGWTERGTGAHLPPRSLIPPRKFSESPV